MSLKQLSKTLLDVGSHTAKEVDANVTAPAKTKRAAAGKAKPTAAQPPKPKPSAERAAAAAARRKVIATVREARAAPVDHTAANLAVLRQLAQPTPSEKAVLRQLERLQAERAANAKVKDRSGKPKTKRALFGPLDLD